MLNQPLCLVQTELQMLKALRTIDNSVALFNAITELMLTEAELTYASSWKSPLSREEYETADNGHNDPNFEIDETYF